MTTVRMFGCELNMLLCVHGRVSCCACARGVCVRVCKREQPDPLRRSHGLVTLHVDMPGFR